MRYFGGKRHGYPGAALADFQRANHPPNAPGLQDRNQEVGMAALWKNNRFGRVCPGFRLGKKFAKGPDALSSNFEESNLVGVSPRDATPTVVEHCHLGTRRLGWIASSNN